MTDNEAEVLSALLALQRVSTDPDFGARPEEFGGTNGSHHAQTLIRAIPKGWIIRDFGLGWDKPRLSSQPRGSCRYRITPRGVVALQNHLAMMAEMERATKAARDKVDARRAALLARSKELVK